MTSCRRAVPAPGDPRHTPCRPPRMNPRLRLLRQTRLSQDHAPLDLLPGRRLSCGGSRREGVDPLRRRAHRGPAREGKISKRVAVEVTELTLAEAELDRAEADAVLVRLRSTPALP